MKETLITVKDEHFQRVWAVMKETYETERHFNSLETQYRILASQWLLGAFAGMGFVFASNATFPFEKLWLVVAISCIASTGIFQLWRMDIIIYQKLLHATFASAVELEDEYNFLPKIKTRMRNSVPGKDVTHVLFYYYYLSIVFFMMVGCTVTMYLLSESLHWWILLLIPVLVIAKLAWLHRHMYRKSKEELHNKQIPAE